jgi:MoxR-vWA-beta-propeller ternary system domain bpX4
MESLPANQDAPSSLVLFLRSLMAEGRPVVTPEPTVRLDSESVELIAEIYFRAQQELGLETPAFCKATAGWAAILLYKVCQFIACRDIGEDEISAAFAVPCPEPRGPETDWSADLFFRHLPAVCGFARRLSHSDPLNRHLKELAAHWPLSSVGIPELAELDLNSFLEHPALRRLYADRILLKEDRSRLGNPRLDDVLRADLGQHSELAPSFASQLFPAVADSSAATEEPTAPQLI